MQQYYLRRTRGSHLSSNTCDSARLAKRGRQHKRARSRCSHGGAMSRSTECEGSNRAAPATPAANMAPLKATLNHKKARPA